MSKKRFDFGLELPDCYITDVISGFEDELERLAKKARLAKARHENAQEKYLGLYRIYASFMSHHEVLLELDQTYYDLFKSELEEK